MNNNDVSDSINGKVNADGTFEIVGTNAKVNKNGTNESADYFYVRRVNYTGDEGNLVIDEFTHFVYEVNCGHDYGFVYDADYHWNACTKCGDTDDGEKIPHSFTVDGDYEVCVCGFKHLKGETVIEIKADNICSIIFANHHAKA